jgi:L-alanine-DL-glutamate epimerase-like enolase superfamily enzyme
MKITGVDCVLLSAPYADPTDGERAHYLRTGYRSHSFVRVRTDEGLDGIGETYAGVFAPEAVRALISQFERELLGNDPLEVADLRERLRVSSYYWGRMGLTQSVLGGIEIALWDLKAKVLGLPLYELLGGKVHTEIKIYASGGTPKPLDELEHEVRGYAQAGYKAIKIRIVHLSAEEVVARVGMCRDVLGPEMGLAVDASQGLLGRPWTVKEAIEIGRLLEPFHLLWIEEPAEVTNYKGFAEIRKSVNIPIAGGESVTSLTEAEAYLDAGALDIFQPDAAVIGGLGIFRQVSQMCERHFIPIAAHAWSGGAGVMANYHAAFASPNCVMLEMPNLANPLRDELLVRPFEVKNGMLQAPTSPGLGVQLTPELEEEYPFRADSYFRITT